MIRLPYPPSVNHYYRVAKGRVRISQAGRTYRTEVALELAMLQLRKHTGELSVTIDMYPPDKRKRDIDNVLKALMDAMQHGGLYEDDSQISKLTIERRAVAPPGRVEVWIEEAAID